MRRIVMDDFDHDAPVAVLQDGADELWLVNRQYANDLETVVTAAENILRELEDQPRHLPAHLRLLRRLVRPVCRLVHTCD